MSKKYLTEDLIIAANKAAQAAQEVLLRYFGNLSKVDKKVQAGLVTEADVQAEKVIIETLENTFPESIFLAEENSYLQAVSQQKSESGLRWIIDPLDGTTNYVHRFPIFCTSIAAEVDGEVVAGLINVPILQQLFIAEKNKGAYKNGKQIFVSPTKKLEDALFVTGFFPEIEDNLKQQLKIFTSLIGQARGVRRTGSAAFDLCMVAEGIFDVFWEKNLAAWDTAAGALLVREAGGFTSDYDGTPHSPFSSAILATNGNLHSLLLSMIQKALSSS